MNSPWLVRPRGPSDSSQNGHPAPRAMLVCFPHAGGGVAAFRPLALALPPAIDVVAVQPAGRGHRLREPASVSAAPIVHGVTEPLLAVAGELPLLLYGHSMGALLAFEAARALRRRGRAVAHLVVAARAAPQVPMQKPHAHTLPDGELKALIRSQGTTPDLLLDNEELMAMVLPTVRADLQVSECYAYTDEPPLDCPITALRGADDARVDQDACASWSRQTRGSFHTAALPGGHMFLLTHPHALAAALLGAIDAPQPAPPPKAMSWGEGRS